MVFASHARFLSSLVVLLGYFTELADTKFVDPISIDDDEFAHPDSLEDYLSARDHCTFKPYTALPNIKSGECADVGMEICEVETTLPEGEGYFRIVRIGPFTSTGGGQKWRCEIKVHATAPPDGGGESLREVGTFLTRSLVAITEPKTGMLTSFPPL